MTRSEFEELLLNHGDIMLELDGFEFTILTFNNFSVGINNDVQNYNTVDEVLNNYRVNSMILRDVLDKLVLVDCS